MTASYASAASASCSPAAVCSASVVNISGTQYGANAGGITPASLKGKAFAEISTTVGTNSLVIKITHGGTPLSETFFRRIVLQTASGFLSYSIDSYGVPGTGFTADSGGKSVWVWAIANQGGFSSSDSGSSRSVFFYG